MKLVSNSSITTWRNVTEDIRIYVSFKFFILLNKKTGKYIEIKHPSIDDIIECLDKCLEESSPNLVGSGMIRCDIEAVYNISREESLTEYSKILYKQEEVQEIFKLSGCGDKFYDAIRVFEQEKLLQVESISKTSLFS